MTFSTLFTPCRRATDGHDLQHALGLKDLAHSEPLTRLGSINFLGILGRGSDQPRHSRLQHSFATAYLTACMLRTMTETALRHAVAAAMLHDVAQWAFSHTCEGAFERVCGVSDKEILYGMLFDEPPVAPKYHLSSRLMSMGIDPLIVWDLLRDRQEAVALFAGTELYAAAVAAASPINPDTLDGIARAATTFGASCPDVTEIAKAVEWDGVSLRLPTAVLPLVDTFWSTKAKVYRRHIHERKALATEVAASRIVLAEYHYASFRELFELSDENVADIIERRYVTPDEQSLDLDILFRRPGTYEIDRSVHFREETVDILVMNRRYRSIRSEAVPVRVSSPVRYTLRNGSLQRRTSRCTAAAPA